MAAITVEWDKSDRDINVSDWERYLKRYRFSTIFQNWSYGIVSAEHDGFRLLRGYVCKNGRVIGLVQAFIKRSFLLGRSVRIMRGPVFESNVELKDKVAAYQAIKKSFPLLRGNWLTIMPELLDTDTVRAVMTEAGFHQIMVGYRTLWLKLTRSEQDLWAGLHPRWRNQTRKAMGEDLRVSIDRDASWLLDRYEEHMAAVGFYGPTAAMLRKMDSKDFSVATAWHGDARIAATLFIQHGQCATYQVGWSSDAGRKLNAQNLLLWRHILRAKESGVTALDLGGIDPDTAPGIAHFKSGLGGTDITMAGTFI